MCKQDKDSKSDPVVKKDEEGASIPESSEKNIPTEIGGREGPEPVRYGDWEKNGRCIDF